MVIVIGEILIDIFDNYRRIGGAPFNFAFHLKQLGWPVRFLTRIGDDVDGKSILALLDKHDFDLDDVQIDPEHPTGTVQVALDPQGVPTFDIRKDVAYDYLDLSRGAPDDGQRVEMVYFGSLVQRTTACFKEVRHFMAQWDVRTKRFCDINLRPPHVNDEAVRASLDTADIVKLNEEELIQIKDSLGGPQSDDEGVRWIIRTFGIEKLVVTRGSRGSAVYTAQEAVTVPPVKSPHIVDTVGAGDAYAAVMAAGFLKQCGLHETITAATDFASRICALPGAVPEDSTSYHSLKPFMKGDADAG